MDFVGLAVRSGTLIMANLLWLFHPWGGTLDQLHGRNFKNIEVGVITNPTFQVGFSIQKSFTLYC